MPYFEILRLVALLRAGVSEERIASMIRVKSILRSMLQLLSDFLLSDDGSDKLLRNVGSYKSHTTSHSSRRHSSI
jgi:hypothetical protein